MGHQANNEKNIFMLFNSFEFLVFLPIVFLLYWFVFRSRRWQNMLIVVASYVFYGWWDWRFLLLIALTSFCSFISGLLLEHYGGNRSMQRAISASNIILNLAILGIFKYYNFFIESLDDLSNTLGYPLDWGTINVILPVGISFYTFQALSYTIDVYRGNIRATRDMVEFFAYICFFPQLVAGPIERSTNLLPQFQGNRQFDCAKATDGCRQMLWGFFKKMVIADNCATVVNYVWDNYYGMNGFALLVGSVLFSVQIYCDFSGYSDIAIGCARLFGFDLMKNFDFPYFSRNIPEFWRRWHISLTTWFRDYIYIPLGGNRVGLSKVIRNIFIVWGISGLWHGANWTFVCWGLYHATMLTVCNLLHLNTKYAHTIAYNRYLPNIKEVIQVLFTFALVSIGWIIFRAESMTDAIDYISALCSCSLFNVTEGIASLRGMSLFNTLCMILFMVMVEWCQRNDQHGLQFTKNTLLTKYKAIRYFAYILITFIILSFAGKQSDFIYFQF